MKTYSNGVNGTVFIATVLILGIVVMICAGLSVMVGRDIYTAKRLRTSTQAYFLAEAGIEESIQDLCGSPFNFDHFPKNKSAEDLGIGSFSAILDTSKYNSDKIIKISSTGSVGDVSRTISATVKDTRITAFTYTTLSGGKMWIALNNDVSGNVHSNNGSQSPIFPALRVGVNSEVHGNATACGRAYCSPFGTVDDTLASNKPSIPMPPFDDAFWNRYYQRAFDSDDVYSGNTIFTSNQSPANGVIWVNGRASLIGTWTMTGCLIATGSVNIIGSITQVPQVGNERFPAIVSRTSRISILGTSTINGLIYAGSRVEILNNGTINGAIICNGRLSMFFTDLNYVKPDPPGLNTPLEVICWSD